MKNSTIVFTAPGRAELIHSELNEPGAGQVLVRTEYTVVSAGTERDCLINKPNVTQTYPKVLGYCGIGYVEICGDGVKGFKPGDRVLVYHGKHARYNLVGEDQLTKVTDDKIDSKEAVFVIIASMSLGGVRKLEVELGESAMVMGQGILGIFATQLLALSGANPVIAVDYDSKRREKALEVGADFALSPGDPDFTAKVKEITEGKGVRATVEVTGASQAMVQALECASWMGRIALLGCTRISDCPVDYYTQVHRPGVKLIGAHNFVRPKVESYPHHWTHHDDCRALLSLIGAGKFKVSPVISQICKPDEAPEVYARLAEGKDFPLGVMFSWI
jgi:2-desacetyl-2-hydroxyethyl bacteriochlorophyllide A dehydrogenase